MAVEARYIAPFPPKWMPNRYLFSQEQSLHNNTTTQIENFLPLSGTPAMLTEAMLPTYQSGGCDVFPGKSAGARKSDSGLTYNVAPVVASGKRSRDLLNDQLNSDFPVPQKNKVSSFLEHETALEVQRQQTEIDRLISQHTQRLRMELEERAKQQAKALVSSIQDCIVRKLKEKDEEILKVGKLNWMLQERVKTLCMENQIWRSLAQTNEATANSLRTNLEHVLAAADCGGGAAAAGMGSGRGNEDDAESCCGSSDHGREEEDDDDADVGARAKAADGGSAAGTRACKACGGKESCVLLLPCRHLCLCTVCGSTCHDCPVCGSAITASVHVNLS